jgi:hypothetical protein
MALNEVKATGGGESPPPPPHAASKAQTTEIARNPMRIATSSLGGGRTIASFIDDLLSLREFYMTRE